MIPRTNKMTLMEAIAIDMASRWCHKERPEVNQRIIQEFGSRVAHDIDQRELFEAFTFQRDIDSLPFHVRERYERIIRNVKRRRRQFIKERNKRFSNYATQVALNDTYCEGYCG